MAKILVIGKKSAERDTLSLLLDFSGHECYPADSLSEAVSLIKKESYDLALADATLLPGNPGRILQTLRAASPKLSALILTEEVEDATGSEETVTHPYSPLKSLSTQFASVRKREALLVLLPEEEATRRLPGLPEATGMLNKLAVLYHSQKSYSAAEHLYKRALKKSESVSVKQHPEVATILYNLGRLYHDRGRFAEAEGLYKRSLAIVEKAFGPEHSKVARRLRNLTELYREQGRDEEAAPLYKRMTKIEKRHS